MKSAVTGSKGFLGSYFTSQLDSVSAYCGNLKDFNEAAAVIYHFAGTSRGSKRDLYKSNVDDLDFVLENAIRNNSVICFPSSCALYGFNKKRISFTEGDLLPLDRMSDYARSKYLAERKIIESGCKYLIFRLFNIFGPNQDENFIIPQLLKHKREDEEILIKYPNRELDFIYIGDVFKSMTSLVSHYSGNKILNLGSGVSISIRQIAESLEVPHYLSDRTEPEFSFSNNEKIESALQGFSPKSLFDILGSENE